MKNVRFMLAGLLMSIGFGPSVSAQADVLESALRDAHRTPEFVLRDEYRHPLETLKFFGVEPEMTVVEIWPGKGWYTEILAPHLQTGTIYAAHFPTGMGVTFYDDYHEQFVKKLAEYPTVYGQVILASFDPKRKELTVPDGRADQVLTFRNVHNWLRSESEAKAFALFYKALKPGGVLGVVEHRALEGSDWETMKTSGYVTEQYVIDLAEKAGFVLEEKSDINRNARDVKAHPKGVWTLPPTLRLKDLDRNKYVAIGESDRMTLKFRKPE